MPGMDGIEFWDMINRTRGCWEMDMTNTWTHSICGKCWSLRGPGREAARLKGGLLETCCFCGVKHSSGIYVMEDPDEVGYCECD